MDLFTNDPALYRKLSEPMASQKDADAAIAKFEAGVRKLREECHIANVYLIGHYNCLNSDGNEMAMQFHLTMGDYAMRLPLVAQAYAIEKQRHTAILTRIIKGDE